MANRWGSGRNEAFNGSLSANFGDNEKLGYLPQATTVILLLQYTKGTESLMELKVEYSSQFDGSPIFYEESIMDINTKEVLPFVFKFPQGGNLRIPLPISVQEKYMRVSVRGVGTVSGSFILDFVEDRIEPRP